LKLLIGIIAGVLFLGLIAAIVFRIIGVRSVLTMEVLIAWFKGHEHLIKENSDYAGFTIVKHQKNGRYVVTQGIINTKTNEIVGEGVKYETKDICDELKNGEELKIYT
jgi:hypothetical protein